MAQSKEAKVLEYERFVEERLKVDLQQAMDDRYGVVTDE